MQTGNEKSNDLVKKKVCLITNGCPENRIDSSRLMNILKKKGCTIVKDYRNADFIFFNACALTQNSEDLSINIINRLKKGKKFSTRLIVYGCLPKINLDRLKEFYSGPAFGSDEIDKLTDLFKLEPKTLNTTTNKLIPYLEIPLWDKFRAHSGMVADIAVLKEILLGYPTTFNPKTFCIKVSTGCFHSCSYCAIKVSRGSIVSKPINMIVEEFKRGIAKDCHDIALIGTDLGSYGRDLGQNLVDLLFGLVKIDGNYKIKLRNIHPEFLIERMPEFIDVFQSGKIGFIGSSAQSGNNRILKLMKRGYRIEDFKNTIQTIKNKFPEIEICTQVMAAFPGETEDEFNDTLRFLDEGSFNFVEVFLFQPRPNTEAALMKSQIPEKIARRRYRKLILKSILVEKRNRRLY